MQDMQDNKATLAALTGSLTDLITSLPFKNSLTLKVLIDLLKAVRLVKPTVSGKLFHTFTTLQTENNNSNIATY